MGNTSGYQSHIGNIRPKTMFLADTRTTEYNKLGAVTSGPYEALQYTRQPNLLKCEDESGRHLDRITQDQLLRIARNNIPAGKKIS